MFAAGYPANPEYQIHSLTSVTIFEAMVQSRLCLEKVVNTFIGSIRADEGRKLKELTILRDWNCGGFGFTCEIL